MKKVPKNRFTERLNNIYEELHLDGEKQFLADIVVSNLIDIRTEEYYSFFDCGYSINSFFEMIDMLSQSDDFVLMLKEANGFQTYEMLARVLDRNTGIKYDNLERLFSILTGKYSPIVRSDIEHVLDIDSKIAKLQQTITWYKYLEKAKLLDNYLALIKS